jgi:type II secretory pathway pseudopilin PulG
MKAQRFNHKVKGYSLVEVLVATVILMVGVGAACSMSLALVTNEEGNYRAARAMNYYENAMTLYQLGLDPAKIAVIMPPEPALVSITFFPNTTSILGIGAPERADVTMSFTTSPNTYTENAAGKKTQAWSGTAAAPGDILEVDYLPGTWTGGANGGENIRTTAVTPVYRTSFKAIAL